MGKIGAKILYLLIALSFVSTAIVGISEVAADETHATLQVLDYSYDYEMRLFNALSWVSTVFTTGTLLVFINMYRATKKDTAITQGTLDAKQNQTLVNNVITMNAIKYLLETQPEAMGIKVRKDGILKELTDATLRSTELAATRIDISAASITDQIALKQRFIENQQKLSEDARKAGDVVLATASAALIKKVQSEIQSLMKKMA